MFSITSPVRVDALYRYAKREGVSFFILCLFVLLKALNRVPQLRQRVEEGDVWEYESVDALVPVLAADGEFTQILVEYRMELSDFLEHAVPLVQAAKLAPAQANPCHRADIAVFSCLPWIPFTQVASAYRVFRDQYFPLIHWGKVEEDVSGRMVMPELWRPSSTPSWLSRKRARRTVSGETLYWLASAERPRIFCPGWYFPLTTLAAISTAICL